jgi:DNA-binding transcriptional LysR family regulator
MDWVPDLRQLRAFVAVVEEGSFTLAARRIFVTQSAVSHSLRTLEEQLSCRLLDRTGKRVAVTAEGELLLRRCKRVIFELEQASRDLDGLRRWGQTRIRIGAPHSLCHFLIPSVLREFRECFPRCEPVIEAGDTTLLLDRLAGADLDLVVGLKPRGKGEDGYRQMFKDRLALVVSPFHPWALDSSSVTSTINDHQFIIYAKATETHRLIEEWLEARHRRGNRRALGGGARDRGREFESRQHRRARDRTRVGRVSLAQAGAEPGRRGVHRPLRNGLRRDAGEPHGIGKGRFV